MSDDIDNGRGLMAFWSSIEPRHQLAFQRWHNAEHIPERVSTPGFLKGRRYRSIADPERFLMFYETRDPSVLSGAAYLARLNSPTRWTKEALTWFRKSTRAVFELAEDSGSAGGWPSPVLVSVRFDVNDQAPTDTPPAIQRALQASGLFTRIRRYRQSVDNRSGKSNEAAIHGAGTGTLAGLLMAYSSDIDLLDLPEPQARLHETLARSLGAATLASAEVETYALEFALDSLAPDAASHG